MNQPNTLFRPSKYHRPQTIPDAVSLLSTYGYAGRILAGGTDMMIEKNPQVQALIDADGLGLSDIDVVDGYIQIGATARFCDIASSNTILQSPASVLSEASLEIGTPQIRNMATIGGNLCSAVPSADMIPPLLAMDAKLDMQGPGGERSVDIDTFFTGVRETVLAPDEILTTIRVPLLSAETVVLFCKKGRVAAGDLAIVNIAVRLRLDEDQTIRDIRIALGAVSPTCIRAVEAERILEGQPPGEALIHQAALMATTEIKPISDIRASAEYRTSLVRVLVEELLQKAAGLST